MNIMMLMWILIGFKLRFRLLKDIFGLYYFDDHEHNAVNGTCLQINSCSEAVLGVYFLCLEIVATLTKMTKFNV